MVLLLSKGITMKLTIKGQVTIPKKYRQRYGLDPHTEIVFEEAADGVLIRPAGASRSVQLRKSVQNLRGIADGDLGTDEILKLTRED